LASFVIAFPLDSSSPPENKSTNEELGVSRRKAAMPAMHNGWHLWVRHKLHESLIVKDELNLVKSAVPAGHPALSRTSIDRVAPSLQIIASTVPDSKD
jgi:hypothetical protein